MKSKDYPAMRLPTVTPKPEQRPSVSLRVPPELFARIEAFRREQPIRPSLKETVVYLIERGIGTKT